MPRGGSVGSLDAIAVTLHQLDVVVRRAADQLEVGVGQRPARLGGAAHHERPARDPRPRRDQRPGGDDGLRLDHDPVEHDRPDGDQAVRLHPRPVEPDGVPQRHVVADLNGVGSVDVDHGAVLDVGVVPDPDPVDVGPDDALEPHAGMRPKLHVADHVGALFHERRFVDAGRLVLERAEHLSLQRTRGHRVGKRPENKAKW
jgi:hypothetical protein